MQNTAKYILAVAFVLAAQDTGSTQLRDLVGVAFEARVVSVIDGDTVDAIPAGEKRAIRIRLEGIDAPERGEPFSDAARRLTRVMLFDQRARIEGRDVDRYGRLVARAYVDGSDASIELLRAGLACVYWQYSSDTVLARTQAQAEGEGRGFWATGASKPRCAQTGGSTAAVQRNTSRETIFHGNTSSRVYHAPSCRNYNCPNCTRVFRSEAEAQAAGFRPAGDCLRR